MKALVVAAVATAAAAVAVEISCPVQWTSSLACQAYAINIRNLEPHNYWLSPTKQYKQSCPSFNITAIVTVTYGNYVGY